MEHPTKAEQFFFENNGYLVRENFLPPDLLASLLEVSERVVAERRQKQEKQTPHTGMTHLNGESTRIFYILGDDPLFLEMMTYAPLMPYIYAFLNEKPHHHASDYIIEHPQTGRGMGWHLDGHDNGYRNLRNPIPLLQLKVGYFLSDMTEPGRGNLCIIPGSHKTALPPDANDLQNTDLFEGAIQVCVPAGSMVMFHNALWHSGGPWTQTTGARKLLYYAYEHPWMVGSQEHWCYPPEFYKNLTPAQRSLFHGFVFDPPEARWG